MGGTYICLSGGEPTIVKNIDEYIKIANEYGLATRINTNGWNVTKTRLEKWLKNGLDQIVLSIYGIDEKTIENTRGSNLIYKRSIKAIDAITELKQKYKFIFILQTVIMKENYKEIPNILKLAIDAKADLFWPSYLEDAINLPDVRLNKEEILDFKKNVIPKMEQIIINENFDKRLEKRLLSSLKKYYENEYEDYIYHKKNCGCHWIGSHFTFYPNGIIDPCPGHEYFKSKYQFKIDYDYIDEFMSIDNLERTKKEIECFDYCKYCPQGEHRELSFVVDEFHEHSSKEDVYDL